MTFTISLKEEISKRESNMVEENSELLAYLLAVGKFSNNLLTLTNENASVTRRIYKDLKEVYSINPIVTVRIQKRFRVKQIYILSVKEKINLIKSSLEMYKIGAIKTLVTDEERIAFLMGSFLAVGTVSDPKSKGYHLEFSLNKESYARNINQILKYYHFMSKIIKRGNKFIVYIKSSEDISDLIKMFGATNSLFYFEDIRIYRDHKNMVNRLNNCEVANQEKTISTGLKQIETINYLKKNDLLSLLDEKTLIVMEMREKYPEVSFQELANIISMETDYKIGKSGINHHFIKMNEIVSRHKKNKNEKI
jgi:DNA-binding protein WhiA